MRSSSGVIPNLGAIEQSEDPQELREQAVRKVGEQSREHTSE
jgi:hypothetical protein